MKSSTFLAGLSVLASQASAHYIFQQLTYGGTTYPAYQYIRKNTDYNSPVIDLTSNDLRCNAGGADGSSTDTLSVVAGQKFTFTSDVKVYHNGPLSIYMAKAPTTAAAFDGSGEVWFKIYDLGPTFAADGTSSWPLAQTYTYTIPPALPNGEYLLRIQQLGIHNPYPGGIPQFYIECAHVSVTGGGSGTPGPLVSIPGAFKDTDPGYTVNIYSNFHNYTVPGPAVWAGQSAGAGSAPAPTSAPAPAPTSAPVSSAAPTTKPATTLTTVVKTTSAVAAPTGATVAKYGQCGGQGWTGATACVAGTKCTAQGSYYSQCL